MDFIHQGSIDEDDWRFIAVIDARFPEKSIRAKFNSYAALTPDARLARAMEDLKKVLRAGWKRIGIPAEDVQNVFDHQEGMKRLCGQHARAVAIAGVHDVPEVIAGDFTPHDDISKADKSRIEYLAAKIIFQAHPDLLGLWLEYETGTSEDAHIVKDIDKCEMLETAAMYERKYPHLKEALDHFWTGAVPKIVTETGKACLAKMSR